MLSPVILVPAVLNGLMTGAVYALVALGLTLIYGVLHIINFAHGALLTAAMFAAFFAYTLLGIDPYVAAVLLTPLFFGLGYALQRFVIGPAAHGDDRLTAVLRGAAVQVHSQGVAVPHLAARHDVAGLAAVAGNRGFPEEARLGAVEGLAAAATEEAEAELVRRGQAEGEPEELRKAAWRGLRRSKRARQRAARQSPEGAG